ncbi:hypothetical protein A0H81_08065 [Grifola frondosa]|uniref:ABC transmembrane type-1 domain-containing protein n=1 Tax=Grifola frondosa TaxID=5627 RepID=A0A1C7M735_GRIFR|nr:hypothetical protein A0H81_08065 [Grifola frondosa]
MQNASDASSVEPATPWIAPEFTVVLSTLVPACTALLLLAYDLLSAVQYPKYVRHAFITLTAPFRTFLTPADLEEPVDCPIPAPPWKARALTVLAVLEAAGWAAVFAYYAETRGGTEANAALGVQAAVGCLAWFYAALRATVKPPVTPPYLLILFYLTYATAALLELAFAFMDGGWAPRIPSNEYTMPEDSATMWSWNTFSFVEPLFAVANARTVNDSDVWTLSPFFTHKNLFTKYLQYCNEHPTHSLLRFLLVSNSLDLIIDVALELWSAVVGFVPPYCLQRILTALADPSPDAKTTAYVFAIVAFLANLSFAQKDVNHLWFTRRCYERTRGQLFCALHYKALKRRDIGGKSTGHGEQEDEGSADLGKIVNLMQGDSYVVAQRFWSFSPVFMAPVRLTIAMIFLYHVLGWSSLAPVAVIVVVYVLNYPLLKYEIFLTRKQWKARDDRMNLINELFQNIRFLKFYGWEMRWSNACAIQEKPSCIGVL